MRSEYLMVLVRLRTILTIRQFMSIISYRTTQSASVVNKKTHSPSVVFLLGGVNGK